MGLTTAEKYQQFREEVRAFLVENLPAHISEKVRLGKRLQKSDLTQWHAILNGQGWLAANWPAEHGGAEWDAMQRLIFEEEACSLHAPRLVPFGLAMLGPVLLKFGSEAQKAHFLPRILNGEHFWCQGYSEPGAGTDLASLQTRAVREGDHYIINGQKTWTTMGQHANWIFCLVRTDPDAKKQEGISFVLVDMATPGVTVRPIVLFDGEPEVNEVFFDDVRVPVENLVGEEGLGWTYAKYLLQHERTNIAGVGFSNALLDIVKSVARDVTTGGKPLRENPHFAARLAQLEIDLLAMRTTNLRVISAAAAGQAPGTDSSMLKVKGTQIRQELSSLLRRAVGPDAMPYVPEFLEGGDNVDPGGPDYAPSAAPNYFNMRKLSIFGGSNEIQRTIIAKSILSD